MNATDHAPNQLTPEQQAAVDSAVHATLIYATWVLDHVEGIDNAADRSELSRALREAAHRRSGRDAA